MREILPGVWHWTAVHPDIGQEVSSYYLEDASALLDPLLPAENADAAHPVHQVILTNRLHTRDAPRLHDRYGCSIRVPRAGLDHFRDKPFPVEPYETGEMIAPGVRSLEFGAIAPDDGVLHIETGRGALHFADGLLHHDGRLALMPDELMDDPETVKAKTFARLEPLLELDFDALLFAHSDPIPSGGRDQLAAFVSSR